MSLFRRSSLLVLTAALALSVLGAPAASASGTSGGAVNDGGGDVTAAEQLVVELINERRDRKGLRPLRLDSRLA